MCRVARLCVIASCLINFFEPKHGVVVIVVDDAHNICIPQIDHYNQIDINNLFGRKGTDLNNTKMNRNFFDEYIIYN